MGQRAALDLVLNPQTDPHDLQRLDLASLLLVGTANGRGDSAVADILHGVAAELSVLSLLLVTVDSAPGACVPSMLRAVERRVRVAAELHRRMVQEQAEDLDVTMAGEGGRS